MKNEQLKKANVLKELALKGFNEEKRILTMALSAINGSDNKHRQKRSAIDCRLRKLDIEIKVLIEINQD